MAQRVTSGFIFNTQDPGDARLSHNGRPWTNPETYSDGISNAYAGLVAVDTSDDTLWVLSGNADNANMESEWTQIESGSNVTFNGDSSMVITNVADNTNTSFANGTLTISGSGGGSGITSVATAAPVSGNGTDMPVTIADGAIAGAKLANGAINHDQINTDAVRASNLDVSTAGTNGQILARTSEAENASGSLQWIDAPSGGDGVPNGATLPATSNPEPSVGDLFNLTSQDGDNIPGLYTWQATQGSAQAQWIPLSIGFAADNEAPFERVRSIVYDSDRRTIRYSLNNGDTVAERGSLLLGVNIVTSAPQANAQDGIYGIINTVANTPSQRTLTITSKSGTAFSQVPGFSRLNDEIFIDGSITTPARRYRLSGTITNIDTTTSSSQITYTISGYSDDLDGAEINGTQAVLSAQPAEGIVIQDGEGNVQEDHHTIRFTNSTITESEGTLNVQINGSEISVRDGAERLSTVSPSSSLQFVGSEIEDSTAPNISEARALGSASRTISGTVYKGFAVNQPASTDELAFAATEGLTMGSTFSVRILASDGIEAISLEGLTVSQLIGTGGIATALPGGSVAVAALTAEQLNNITPLGLSSDSRFYFTEGQIEVYHSATIPTIPEVQVDVVPDLTFIRSTGPTRHGEAVTLNSDGSFTTQPFPSGPGGGVTEDEVQRDIHNYTDPRFITSRLQPTFSPTGQAFLNANREPSTFTPFNIHRLVNAAAGVAVMSFETSEDALAFAADIQGFDSIGDLIGTIPNIPANATTAQQWGALRVHNPELVATNTEVMVTPQFTSGGNQVTILTGVQNTLQADRGRFFNDQNSNYNDGNGVPTPAGRPFGDVEQFRENFTGLSGRNVRSGLGTTTGDVRYVTFAYDNDNWGVFRSQRVGSGNNVSNVYDLIPIATRGRTMTSRLLRVYTAETLSDLPGVTGEFVIDNQHLTIAYRPADTSDGRSWTVPFGHTFTIQDPARSTTARRDANSSFFVTFAIPPEDTEGLAPVSGFTFGRAFRDDDMWTTRGYPTVTYGANRGPITTSAFQGERDVIELEVNQAELNRLGAGIGSIVQFATGGINPFRDAPFTPRMRIRRIDVPTQDDINNSGGGGSPLAGDGARIVTFQLFENENTTGNDYVVNFGIGTSSQFTPLAQSDFFPSRLLVGSAQAPQLATITRPGLAAQQHVDVDNIPYDAELFISGPNANEIHWVSASTAQVQNGETLYGFQFDDPAPQSFPVQIRSGGGTFSLHDLNAVVETPPNNAFGHDRNGNTVLRYHGRTTPQLRNFLLGQDISRTGTGGRPNVNLLDVGNLTGTQQNVANGQIQAFYSRQSGDGDSENIRATTERTQFLLRPEVTIDGEDGIALSISDHGDTSDASSRYGALRSRLDAIRVGSNPQSAASRQSLLFGVELGVSIGANFSGCQLTGIIITDNNGDNVQNAGATAPLFDVVNNWSIRRHNNNWVWFYTGSAELRPEYHYQHTYVFRRPLSYVFISSDGPNVVNSGDTPEQRAQRLYPQLTNRDYFRRFVRLDESDRRQYFQGDTELPDLEAAGTIAGELRGNIPFTPADPGDLTGMGTPFGASGLYLKTTLEDIRFDQGVDRIPIWGGNFTAGNNEDVYVRHDAGGLYAIGAGSIGTTTTPGTAPRRNAHAVRPDGSFGVILASEAFAPANREGRLHYLQALSLFGLSTGENLQRAGIYDANGLRDSNGHEIVIRFTQPGGTPDTAGFLVVGIGTRIQSPTGFGQGEGMIEVVPRLGAKVPVNSGNLLTASRVNRATNDPLEQHQVLRSNGFALFRFDADATGSNGSGRFTEVIAPASEVLLASTIGDDIQHRPD